MYICRTVSPESKGGRGDKLEDRCIVYSRGEKREMDIALQETGFSFTHTQIHTNNLSHLCGEHVFVVGGKNILS